MKNHGCYIYTRVSEELYTEDEICSLCCKFCHWHDGGFKSVDMKDSEHFVTGMFRDREFFTPEAFEAYDLQNMTRKLSCGEESECCLSANML